MKIQTNGLLASCALLIAAMTPTYAASYGNGSSDYSTASVNRPTLYSGDHTPSASSAAGIQNAIDNANAAGGGRVVIANQRYTVGTEIHMKDRVRLDGSGITSSSQIARWTGNDSLVSIFESLHAGLDDVQIEDLKIDGWRSTSELIANENGSNGFWTDATNTANYNNRVRMLRVDFRRCSLGLLPSGTTHFRVEDCNFYQNGHSSLAHNIYSRRLGRFYLHDSNITQSLRGQGYKSWGGTFSTSSESKYYIIDYNYANDNYRNGINPNGIQYSRLERNTATNNGESGIFLGYNGIIGGVLYGTARVDCINNWSQYNADYGIFLEYGNRVNIEGNYANSNAAGQYQVNSSNRVSNDNNTTL
ncbi:MAG: right-handed parallel beta-helix repeat-containing protein [Opitutaceae bacterium]